MIRRRLMVTLLAFLAASVIVWVTSIMLGDKKESFSRHLTLLEHLGQTASRIYGDSKETERCWASGPPRKPNCTPENQVVFIKTHKTASSTTSGIFDHYAYKNNLTVVMPPEGQPYMDRKKLFHRDMMAATHNEGDGWKKEDGFNMFTSHARYNRREMDAIVHNAKYVTIIRDPRSQFVSSFVYFNFVDRFKRVFKSRGEQHANVIEGFLKNPIENLSLMSQRIYSHVLWNQQMFDLGLEMDHFTDKAAIDAIIHRLGQEFDVVMLTEYYDESLLLLRDTLCWETEDILYTARLVRNTSLEIPVDDATLRRISAWNAADTQLYDYFNRTLWERIAAYGPSFQEELRSFRQLLSETSPQKTGKHSRDTKKIMKRMRDRGIYVR